MKKLIFSVYEKHQANRLSSIQEAVELFSDTLQLLRGNEIISGAKLTIYQNSSMAHSVTRHLRLLRQLKWLTALKTSSKSQNYTYITLLTC